MEYVQENLLLNIKGVPPLQDEGKNHVLVSSRLCDFLKSEF
jgi:hypothetical protein